MLCLSAATSQQQSELEQPPALHTGRCCDGDQHHGPVPARMCPDTSSPQLAAAWPRETTITLQAAWGAFLAPVASHCEEMYLPTNVSEMEGA